MHAAARTDPSPPDRSVVQVTVRGGAALSVLDGRVPRFSAAEVEEAALKLEERSGAVVQQVRARTEASWQEVRGELNRLAGGQASARVMVLAHHALRAHQALELQALAVGKAFGAEDDLAEKHMRNQAGLAVVASDALNKAYEVAREEAKANAGSPTEQLLTRLGVASSDPVPPEGRGGTCSLGPVPAESPEPPK